MLRAFRLGLWLLVPALLVRPAALRAEAPRPLEPVVAGRVTLELDVLPILTAAGCNSGACHGKAGGQNGFQLSLLGFDPDFDYRSLAINSRGRRLFPAAPDKSLVLLKPTAQLPHGGGKRFERDSVEYAILRAWIAQGMPRAATDAPRLERISLSPGERGVIGGEEVQLAVTAHYSDGSTRDVTWLTDFSSTAEAVVAVDENGLIRAGQISGAATITARYMYKLATWNTAIPLPGKVDPSLYANLPRHNFIDALVWQKLEQLAITPSEPADDATFLRRAYLDAIGCVPTPEEARAFLDDPDPDKRAKLIDHLLERPEYADFWANKWADLLRPNPYRVGIKATFNFDNWIRGAFRQNMPHDEFVRQLVAAQGSTWRNGATVWLRDRRTPDELAPMASRLFLGIRLECAKCHHHPFEVWGQDDFYSLAAYFARLGHKGPGLSPPISGGEEMFFTAAKGQVKHPLTGEVLEPRPLFGEAPPIDEGDDPRAILAEWMTSDDNPYFAKAAVNRIWGDLMGRGLVEPVDDLRATNPPSNPALLDALAEEFRRQDYDRKKIMRTIMTSYVYGLSSLPGERNVADTQNYSRHYRKRLRAEVLLDAVCDVTGVPSSFAAMPPDTRSVQIWTHRIDSLFLDSFGRPNENQDPPCERMPDTTVVQTLHMMNAPALHAKITNDQGRAAKLAAGDKPPSEIIEELYLAAYARRPTSEERAALLPLYAEEGADRRRTTEDILWALMNTPEFLFEN